MRRPSTAFLAITACIVAACMPRPEAGMPTEPFEINVTPDAGESGAVSLERARDTIREWKHLGRDLSGGITVQLHRGTYTLAEPFTLTAEDSGVEGGPIVYRAVDGEDVTFSGGKAVLGWGPHRGDVLRADVSGLGLSKLPAADTSPIQRFELFYRGERMELARWPNRDSEAPAAGEWAYIADAPGAAPADDEPTKSAPACPVQLGQPGDSPLVDGEAVDPLTPSQWRLARSLVAAYPGRLT